MEASIKVVALTMLDAYSKMLELSSVNNLVSDKKINANMFKFDIQSYLKDFKTSSTQPQVESYVVTESEQLSTEEIILQSHEAKTNYEKVAELYSRYGELNKIVLRAK